MVLKKIVIVASYNPEWQFLFQQESTRLKQALGDNCLDVIHVGSTSIPGMSAKPIIDMLPVVRNIYEVDESALETMGYTCRGELGMMFRKFCQKTTHEIGFHLHLWEEGNAEIDKHLLFREYLINNPDAFQAYEALKLKLADQHGDDQKTYTLKKDNLIKSILHQAGFHGRNIVQALTPGEWGAYHRIRKEQIYDMLGIKYDPNHPTLTQENHFHFVLSLGTQIIGLAHIEFLDKDRAALRPFAIDTPYHKQGHGTWFLAQLESWLAHQGKSLLLFHAAPSAVPFYQKHGYSPMAFDEGKKTSYEVVDMGKTLGTEYNK